MGSGVRNFLTPLPISYSPLPISYSLLPIPHSLLPSLLNRQSLYSLYQFSDQERLFDEGVTFILDQA